jgi:hypothetical protein
VAAEALRQEPLQPYVRGGADGLLGRQPELHDLDRVQQIGRGAVPLLAADLRRVQVGTRRHDGNGRRSHHVGRLAAEGSAHARGQRQGRLLRVAGVEQLAQARVGALHAAEVEPLDLAAQHAAVQEQVREKADVPFLEPERPARVGNLTGPGSLCRAGFGAVRGLAFRHCRVPPE